MLNVSHNEFKDFFTKNDTLTIPKRYANIKKIAMQKKIIIKRRNNKDLAKHFSEKNNLRIFAPWSFILSLTGS
jgi:hypothetical protein